MTVRNTVLNLIFKHVVFYRCNYALCIVGFCKYIGPILDPTKRRVLSESNLSILWWNFEQIKFRKRNQ